MRGLWLLFGCLMTMARAQASGITVLQRVDTIQNGAPVYATAFMTPSIEFWSLAMPHTPDLEIGRLWPVFKAKRASVLLGGYGVYWPKSKDWFILPWINFSVFQGKTELSGDIAYYAPLGKGPEVLLVSEIFLGQRVNSRLKIGVATGAWDQSGDAAAWGFGPAVKFQLGQQTSLRTRYLIDQGEPTHFGLRWSVAFKQDFAINRLFFGPPRKAARFYKLPAMLE